MDTSGPRGRSLGSTPSATQKPTSPQAGDPSQRLPLPCRRNVPRSPKQHVVDLRALRVAVADQEPEPAGTLIEVPQQVTRPLRPPRPSRVSGDADQMHPPTLQLDHEQNVEPGQAD